MKCCYCIEARTFFYSILAVLGFSLVLLVAHQVLLPILGYVVPFLVPTLYDIAVYGAYPTVAYTTFDLEGPSTSIVAWNDRCDDGLILLSPFGPSVPGMGPVILDADGDLVWMASNLGTVMNLKVQKYQGENYLTFWAGAKFGGIGMGNYHMLNSSYDVVRTVSAVSSEQNPRQGDLHDFVITDEGTALLTIYNTTQFDISAMGRPKDGWIVDSLFQEVDMTTGELIFEWRASDHFDPSESFYLNPFGGYKESNPYDFFHINSVEKDKKGNYLISSRHYHSLTYLSPEGEILWTLGGDDNDFEDLSDGQATSFKWQHDGRWIDEEAGILSLFDNGSAGPIMRDADHSLGLVIQIDVEKRTARLLHAFSSKGNAIAASQGSVQTLSNGHTMVGWGAAAAWSEFDSDGTLLCEMHITPSILFWWERVKSYRVLKSYDWIGRPEYPPTAKKAGDKVYVSWNGATEVRAWQLEGRKRGTSETEWTTVDIKDKTGFEDIFTLSSSDDFTLYRVAALDSNGGLLKHSDPVDEIDPGASIIRWVFFGVCAALGVALGTWLFVRRKPGMSMPWLRTKVPVWDRFRYSKVSGFEMT